MIIPLLSLMPFLTSGTEVARLRNALVFDSSGAQDFHWTPDTLPRDFLLDTEPPDPYFVAVVRRLRLEALPTDWERAKAIASHLIGSHPPLLGGAVQADLTGTYEAIVERGEGYCADFVLVFRALAAAAGVPVRAWAFSFDGFGGYGHVWPEVWDRQARAWHLLDVYNNNYFVRTPTSAPLSALAFRQTLLDEPDKLRVLRIDAGQPPGYVHEEKLRAYYRQGLPEWYLWWGNNPFTYEGAAPYRWLLLAARPAAQALAMAGGVHPGIRPLVTAQNAPRIEAMNRLRVHLWVAGISMLAGLLGLLWVIARALKRIRA